MNSIAPGSTFTPALQGWAKRAPEQFQAGQEANPLGKMADPEDQGNAAMFLCSDLAKHINGVTIPVDGGTVAGKLG